MRAKNIERNSPRAPWPVEYNDFFEAYVACYTEPGTEIVKYEALRNDCGDLFKLYEYATWRKRASDMKAGKTKRSNRWQSLCLDDDGREV